MPRLQFSGIAMNDQDAQIIIIGSGMNSLVCAAVLAKRGKSVLVLERGDRAGGCIRTEELFPGFRHDIMSSWYPLFVAGAGYAELKDELAQAGVEFVANAHSTGIAIPGGPCLALPQDVGEAARRIEAVAPGDGEAFGKMAGDLFGRDAALTFGLLNQSPHGWRFLRLLFSEWRKRRLDGLMAYTAESIESFRRWAERELRSDVARALIAPWVLHTGLGPDEASSALIGKLTFAAVVAGGMPVVRGGSDRIVQGLQAVIEKHGGRIETGTQVDEVRIEGGRATAVMAAGRQYRASQAVVCNVTPTQLYGRLLPGAPQALRTRAQGYRYGRGCMQIHFALDAPAPWPDPEMLKVPMVHLTESMEQVCTSVVQANNGLLPARPTVAIGQPVAVDATRAPAGKWILWLQLQEMPARLKGDELGQIEVPADGRWNEAVREAMADRIQARVESVMPGLSARIIGRRAYSPADLEGMNCNLVGGDPYSGVCSPDQFFWLRPFAPAAGARGHATPYRNVWHIGASTHPGPGLGGGSGYLVAQRLAPH